jgi:hypothetical protein
LHLGAIKPPFVIPSLDNLLDQFGRHKSQPSKMSENFRESQVTSDCLLENVLFVVPYMGIYITTDKC